MHFFFSYLCPCISFFYLTFMDKQTSTILNKLEECRRFLSCLTLEGLRSHFSDLITAVWVLHKALSCWVLSLQPLPVQSLSWRDIEFSQKLSQWGKYVLSTLMSVYVLFPIYWVVFVEPSLHFWNEKDFIVAYDVFNVSLN